MQPCAVRVRRTSRRRVGPKQFGSKQLDAQECTHVQGYGQNGQCGALLTHFGTGRSEHRSPQRTPLASIQRMSSRQGRDSTRGRPPTGRNRRMREEVGDQNSLGIRKKPLRGRPEPCRVRRPTWRPHQQGDGHVSHSFHSHGMPFACQSVQRFRGLETSSCSANVRRLHYVEQFLLGVGGDLFDLFRSDAEWAVHGHTGAGEQRRE
jgi:hypothetical protein